MIARQGRFVEYSVFGKETSVDWTIISDAKGTYILPYTYVQDHVCYQFSISFSLSLICIIVNEISPELTIQGGHCSPYTYPTAISMIEKGLLPLQVAT